MAAALTLLDWVLIAEFVIDRLQTDNLLPFYRYGNVCLWDIAVIIGIAVFVKHRGSLAALPTSQGTHRADAVEDGLRDCRLS